MNSKNVILQKAKKIFTNKSSFSYRVYKLLGDGEFNGVLSSQELCSFLNEGPGKKIKVSCLTALMEPLLKEDIIKIKLVDRGRNKRKYWLPGWIDKNKVESQFITHSSENNVLFFTGRDSWTDPNKNFPKIIEMLKGDLCIVDPYYGYGTFYLLEKFGKKMKIRFLSCTLGNKENQNINQFNIDKNRFLNEFKNIKMKKFDKFYELHDRYIIAKNALVIIGHGIKDLAGKESFVVFLPKILVAKFLPILMKTFEQRWKQSNSI